MKSVSVSHSNARKGAKSAVARRATLLTGAATLSMSIACAAQAQEVVLAREGQTVAGPIQLTGGDDRLILDLTRLRADGTLNLGDNNGQPPLSTTASIDNPGGVDSLWLAATGQQARSLLPDDVEVAGFDGGIVYEAYGANSVLTLNSPPGQSYDRTIHLAGNGTINLTAAQAPIGTTAAIFVEGDTTASRFDNVLGRLTLNLSGTINGTDADRHVDVSNAARLNLVGATIDVRRGTAIHATDQEITIDAQSSVRAKDSDTLDEQNSVLVELAGAGSIVNHGRIAEFGDVGGPGSTPGEVAVGVRMSGGGTLHNARTSATRFGRITMHGNAVVLEDQGGTIVNDGLIQSDSTVAQEDTYAAIASYGSSYTAILRNNAAGVVQGIITNTNGADLGNRVAYQGDAGTDIVVNAGTINGDVNLGGDSEIITAANVADVFLISGAGTVNGAIDGGLGGHDAYGQSFAANGTYTASNAILAGSAQITRFERHGIEAEGAGTTATFTSNEVLTNGLTILGNGTVANQADITLGNRVGIVIHDVATGVNFVNDTGAAVTVGDESAFSSEGDGLASFINRGDFGNSASFASTVDIIADGKPEPFVFNNSGLIANLNGQALNIEVHADTTAGGDLDFTNSGQIRGTGVGAEIDVDAPRRVKLANSGLIEGGLKGLHADAGILAAVNSGTLRSTGEAGVAFLIDSPQTTLENSGTIEANGAGMAVNGHSHLSAGVAVRQYVGESIITNTANGVISARQASSVAVMAEGTGASSKFAFNNSGRVLGSGSDTAGETHSAGDRILFGGTVANAIHTAGTEDRIVNEGAGLIQGNVDLGSEADRFEARATSRLEGELRLGSGDDTLLLAGGTITGISQGGEGADTLLIDLSQDRSINGSNFRSFETIRREGGGTGILTAEGNFDVDTLNLDGMTVRVAASTMLDTQGTVAIQGSDNAERLILEGTVNGDINLGLGDDYVDLANGGVVNGTINGGAGGNDTIGFRITADADASSIPDVVEFESLAVSGNHKLTLDTAFNTVTLRDGADLVITAGAGTIGNILSDDASDQVVVVEGQLTGGVDLGAGNDRLALMDVRGAISNGLIGGDGVDELTLNLTAETIFSNGAQGFETITVTGAAPLVVNGDFGAGQSLSFGEDANSLTLGAGVTFAGNVDGNGGMDALTVNAGGAGSRTTISGEVQAFETLAVLGEGTLALTGASYAFNSASVGGNLALGTNTALASGTGVVFGTGNNHLTLASGASVLGVVDAGDGTDTLELAQAAGTTRNLSAIDGHGTFELLASSGEGEFRIDENAAFEAITLNGGLTSIAQAAAIAAPITGGNANERLDVFGALDGAVMLGDGGDALRVGAPGTIVGDVDLGAGDDQLSLAGTITGNVTTGDGADTISIAGASEGAVDRRIYGNLDTGSGDDVVTAMGLVDGDVNLGAGNDRLVHGGRISGAIIAGEEAGDNDTLEFRTQGTYAAPTVYDGSLTGFETLEVSGGVVSVTAQESSWLDLNVTSGRLIGQAGTTITSAGTIDVAHGATFGSAGIVNGNINVLGTLSPGASPGTMTVNGNVTMGAGSNLVIELTPTAGTDLLDVNGALTIANGAAMDITGALAALPGNVLDIVVADTITGRFTTINKSSTVFGFVVQNGNRIQIRSEFTSSEGMPTNVAASVAYANQVLRDGYAVQTFTAALDVLTDAHGAINQRNFAQLTPEAYGSAVQLGVENGLQLADANRTLRITTPQSDGLYGFAQGLTGSGSMRGQTDTGASRAEHKTRGFFGGIGYGRTGVAQAGAFVGRIDTDQALTSLGARTEAAGWLGGLYADVTFSGLGLHGMVAYSDADATTTRSLVASASRAQGGYGLKSLVADIAVDYSVDLASLAVTPKFGFTYVNVKRDSVDEQGAGDFMLAVDGDSQGAWFGDVGVAISGKMKIGSLSFAPYAEIGVRKMLTDGSVLVSGTFDGAPGSPIVVNGVERDKTVGRAAVGFGLDITSNVRLNTGYTREFSNTNRSSFTAGASIRF